MPAFYEIPYLRESNAHPDFKNLNKKRVFLANVMRISGMVNLNFILHTKIKTNTANHVAGG